MSGVDDKPTVRTEEQHVDPERAAVIVRIQEAHAALVNIAHTLRAMDDFDHAQDMSDAALFCRAAYNDLRLSRNTRGKPVRRRDA